MTDVFEIAVKQPLTLKVDGVEYVLEFPLPAVAEIEKEINRPMKTATDWWGMTVKDVPVIIRAGLTKRYGIEEADAVAASVCDGLGPEQIAPVMDALCAACWPEATRRYKEKLSEIQAQARKGILPNVPSGAAH